MGKLRFRPLTGLYESKFINRESSMPAPVSVP